MCMHYQVLVDSDRDPSSALRAVLAPEIRVKRVEYQGIGQCEDMNRPEIPKVSTEGPKINFPPVPRNQVDHVNATVGQLLVFKVPEVRVLSISIIFIDADNVDNCLYYFCRIHSSMPRMDRRETWRCHFWPSTENLFNLTSGCSLTARIKNFTACQWAPTLAARNINWLSPTKKVKERFYYFFINILFF